MAKKTPSKKVAKKAFSKKSPVKKLAAKKPSSKPKPKSVAKPAKKATKKALKKPAVKKASAKAGKKAPATAQKPPQKTAGAKVSAKASGKGKSKGTPQGNGALRQQFITKPVFKTNLKLNPFLTKQRARLLQLKDTLLDSMSGVARGNLHAGSETSAFGMHQADAGSDAYDRDFALSILSQEQNSLYEIDEALKRIENGDYGKCEICNKPIPHVRLEARPFTRYTVDCQEELEKRQYRQNARLPINSLFGLTEEESENEEEESTEAS